MKLLAEKSKDLASIKKVSSILQQLAAEAKSLVNRTSKIEDADEALDARASLVYLDIGISDVLKIMSKVGPRLNKELLAIAEKLL